RGRGGELFGQLVERLLKLIEVRQAALRFVDQRSGRVELGLLLENRDSAVVWRADFARVGMVFADETVEQRRLAGAVRPDEAHTIASTQLERQAGKHRLAVKLAGEVARGEQNRHRERCIRGGRSILAENNTIAHRPRAFVASGWDR